MGAQVLHGVTPRRLLTLAVAIGAVSAGVFVTLWVVWTNPPSPPDYTQDAAWLCRPGRADSCGTPTTSTVVERDGARHVVTTKPDPNAPIDCFYVYPTVSHARGAYSPIAATLDEREITKTQFSRFSVACRPFAPLYRQVTIAGLPALFKGRPRVNLAVPLADVTAAWKDYLARDNGGRPIVLVGHSQGARLLARLIAAEIDGTPLQKRLVVAILPGAEIDVPEGRDVGGTFQHLPLCSAAAAPEHADPACVIAYSTFLAGKPIPADVKFGVAREAATGAGHRVYGCVDMGRVAGVAALTPVLPLDAPLKSKYGTDFVELPQAVAGGCRAEGGISVFSVEADGDARLGPPTNAVMARLGQYSPSFGLHALDLNVGLATLVEVLRRRTPSDARRQP